MVSYLGERPQPTNRLVLPLRMLERLVPEMLTEYRFVDQQLVTDAPLDDPLHLYVRQALIVFEGASHVGVDPGETRLP